MPAFSETYYADRYREVLSAHMNRHIATTDWDIITRIAEASAVFSIAMGEKYITKVGERTSEWIAAGQTLEDIINALNAEPPSLGPLMNFSGYKHQQSQDIVSRIATMRTTGLAIEKASNFTQHTEELNLLRQKALLAKTMFESRFEEYLKLKERLEKYQLKPSKANGFKIIVEESRLAHTANEEGKPVYRELLRITAAIIYLADKVL